VSRNNAAETVRPFCGLTRYSNAEIPDSVFESSSSMHWWAREGNYSDGWSPDEDAEITVPEMGLNSVIDTLPRAMETSIRWEHPVTGEMVSTTKHNAIIDPERAEQVFGHYATRDEAEADGALEDVEDPDSLTYGDDALYFVPTDDYSIVNPATFLRPLVEVLNEAGLADAVFGEARLYRAGGKGSMDVYLDGKHVEAPDLDEDRKPIVVGLQLDWDHFGGTSVSVQGVGMDWECCNSMRGITEKESVRHTGKVEDRIDWHDLYGELLEALDLKVDQLSQLIEEADNSHLLFRELPDDFGADYDSIIEAFFAYAGLPSGADGYLARRAAENLRAEAENPYEPTWWELHRAATYAISHYSRADVHSGSAIDQQNQIANEMLYNPAMVEENVVRAYRADREEESLSDEGAGVAAIETATGGLADKKAEYEERQDAIARLRQAAGGE